MKFEGIGFNETRLQQLDFNEFKANVVHLLSLDKMTELYNLIHGNDQKPSGQLEKATDSTSDTAVSRDDANELH